MKLYYNKKYLFEISKKNFLNEVSGENYFLGEKG
jgi:hypothetical protein